MQCATRNCVLCALESFDGLRMGVVNWENKGGLSTAGSSLFLLFYLCNRTEAQRINTKRWLGYMRSVFFLLVPFFLIILLLLTFDIALAGEGSLH